MMKLGQMVLKIVNWVHNTKIRSNDLLKGVNWVHNDQNIGVTFLGKWSFISLRNPWISVFDVVLLKVELEMLFLQFLSLNLPENCNFHQKPQFLDQNLCFSSKSTVYKNLQFSSKSTVFIRICSCPQNLQFSSKSLVFVKIHDFHQNSQFLAFLSELLEDIIRILYETKDHLPAKVTLYLTRL